MTKLGVGGVRPEDKALLDQIQTLRNEVATLKGEILAAQQGLDTAHAALSRVDAFLEKALHALQA